MLLLEQIYWDQYYHTHWTSSMDCCLRREACPFSYIAATSATYSEAVLHCTTRTVGGRSMPPSGLLEGLTVFSENTGLAVGRTLVDPSGWKVPVLVSNFGQETVMVEPFSEIGMIAQVAAIQPVMNQPPR